jgi:hypothetical protein
VAVAAGDGLDALDGGLHAFEPCLGLGEAVLKSGQGPVGYTVAGVASGFDLGRGRLCLLVEAGGRLCPLLAAAVGLFKPGDIDG